MGVLPDPVLPTFFRTTNSFSAVALRDTSSSYLRQKRAERRSPKGRSHQSALHFLPMKEAILGTPQHSWNPGSLVGSFWLDLVCDAL